MKTRRENIDRTQLWCRGEREVIRRIRICFLALAVLILAPGVMAQHPEPNKSEAEGERPYEIFGGYSYLREDGHNLNGWTGTFIVNVNHWFAIAADFDGHYGSHRAGLEDVRVREHAFTFGPHVALHNHLTRTYCGDAAGTRIKVDTLFGRLGMSMRDARRVVSSPQG